MKKELEFVPFQNFPKEELLPVQGLSQRVIAEIKGSGIATRILEFEPETDTSPNGIQIHDFWEELYIIEGSIIDLKLNEEFKEGMVACRPPGMEHGPWISPNGCKIFEVRYYSNHEDLEEAKKELEFVPFTQFAKHDLKPVVGLSQRIIAQDKKTGVATRVLEFEPKTDTSANGIQVHDFWEELYIIEGSIVDLELNEEFKEGMVACRPPGMKHGPWISPNGCKIFEVRYYAK